MNEQARNNNSNFVGGYAFENAFERDMDKKNFKDMRNYSFVIPRTKSKDMLDKI